MNLPGFPVAQRGETFASVVARYLARSAASNTCLLKMLGLYNTLPSSVTPKGIHQFASVLPIGHPWEGAPEAVIKGHTLAPLFLHFAHPDRISAVLETVRAGDSGHPDASLGIHAMEPSTLWRTARFCPECIVDDIKRKGFPVSYRQHQPPFVTMCAVHARILHFNCLCTHGSQSSVRKWQMAGRCECARALTPPILEGDLDAKTEGDFLWLSRQVATILEDPDFTPQVSIAANLHAALKHGGFASETSYGLDRKKVVETLRKRFTEQFLRQLGLAMWCESTSRSPLTLLHRNVLDGRLIPSVLGMLLLARLVTDEISSLWRSVPVNPRQKTERRALGYLRGPKLNRERIDRRAIQLALDATKGNLAAAASLLGIRSAKLLTDLRHHRIRVPLSASASERLGTTRIIAVRQALLKGLPMTEIQRLYKVTDFYIRLIEIDRPELCDAHREASIIRQREEHRDSLRSFLRNSPAEPRSAFVKRHSGAYAWLWRFDRTWLKSHLPKSRQGWHGRRKAMLFRDWSSRDQAAATALGQAAHGEFAKTDRPKWLTVNRLLRSIGKPNPLKHNQQSHYPLAMAEAKRLAETKEQFQRRAIRWALQKLAEQNLPISVHRLSPLAGTSREALKEHRRFIIETAAELGLTFAAGSLLAPSIDHPESPSTLMIMRFGNT